MLIAEHERHDVHLVLAHGEALRGQRAAQASSIGVQALHPVRALLQKRKCRQCPGHGGRRRGRGEDQRTGGVDQVARQLAIAAHVGAVGAEGLAERADDHVDLSLQAGGRNGPAAARPEDPDRVCLVDHHTRADRARDFHDLDQRCHVAVHREHRVGDDQRPSRAAAARFVAAHAPFQVLDVEVPVHDHLRPGQTAAVDDRGVVELIREDRVAASRERPDHTEIGQVPRAEQQAGLRAVEGGQALLEATVDRHRPRDQPRGSSPDAPARGRVGGRIAHAWVVGQAEVVVRAQQQHRLAVEQHGGPLRARHEPQAAAQSGQLELGQPLGYVAHAASLARLGR